MLKEKLSKLQFYSLGTVAANKLLGSNNIEVTPVEEFPMLNGEITDNVDSYDAKSVDASGVPFDVKIPTTVSVQAEWLPINNSNRFSSPDVRRGEIVVLYRFADVDGYWWNTLKNDQTLRRLETVIYSFSNNRKENVENDDKSTYYIEISTHTKLIHVHTSKNDGEPFAYDIQLNAKDGNFVITDDAGNYILLDSKESTIHIENALGSFVDINHTKITIHADDIIVNGTNTVTINTETMTSNSSSTGINASGSIAVKGGSSVSVNGGSSVAISSPATSIT